MSANPIENEIKIRLHETEPYPEALMFAGFREASCRMFEANTLYDTADSRLQQFQMMLRIRETNTGSLLTWKGPAVVGRHKSRPEIETRVESGENLREILNNIGFSEWFRYEKFRTEYRRDQQGLVTFDETPIGRFLELEGPADWLDATARELGFGPDRYIVESYGKLYAQECQQRGIQPSSMVFSSKPAGALSGT